MTKWWQERPSRPGPRRIHPYKVEASLIGDRVIASDVKEGKNSVLAGLGKFDVSLFDDVEAFRRSVGDLPPNPTGAIDFADDFSLLPFHVPSKKYRNMVEPSGDVDVSKEPLSIWSHTQVAGDLLSILVHPRLRPLVSSGSLRAQASVLPDPYDREPEPPREVALSPTGDGLLTFEEGAIIGVSYQLMLVVASTAEQVVSSFDFLTVLREARV